MNIIKVAKSFIEVGVIVLLVALFIPMFSPLITPLKEPAMQAANQTSETIDRPEYHSSRVIFSGVLRRAIFRRR